jgi:hypothetical protein
VGERRTATHSGGQEAEPKGQLVKHVHAVLALAGYLAFMAVAFMAANGVPW